VKKVLTILISLLFLSGQATAFDLFEDKIPPLVIDESTIQGALLEPLVVHAGESCTVEALVADDRGIDKVSLLYKVNNGDYGEASKSKTRV